MRKLSLILSFLGLLQSAAAQFPLPNPRQQQLRTGRDVDIHWPHRSFPFMDNDVAGNIIPQANPWPPYYLGTLRTPGLYRITFVKPIPQAAVGADSTAIRRLDSCCSARPDTAKHWACCVAYRDTAIAMFARAHPARPPAMRANLHLYAYSAGAKKVGDSWIRTKESNSSRKAAPLLQYFLDELSTAFQQIATDAFHKKLRDTAIVNHLAGAGDIALIFQIDSPICLLVTDSPLFPDMTYAQEQRLFTLFAEILNQSLDLLNTDTNFKIKQIRLEADPANASRLVWKDTVKQAIDSPIKMRIAFNSWLNMVWLDTARKGWQAPSIMRRVNDEGFVEEALRSYSGGYEADKPRLWMGLTRMNSGQFMFLIHIPEKKITRKIVTDSFTVSYQMVPATTKQSVVSDVKYSNGNALAYAGKYAGVNNNSCGRYLSGSNRSDCAHFIAHCLHSGGITIKTNIAGDTLCPQKLTVRVVDLEAALRKLSTTASNIKEIDFTDAIVGDVGFLTRLVYRPTHALMICQPAVDAGDSKIYGHSTNRNCEKGELNWRTFLESAFRLEDR